MTPIRKCCICGQQAAWVLALYDPDGKVARTARAYCAPHWNTLHYLLGAVEEALAHRTTPQTLIRRLQEAGWPAEPLMPDRTR